MVQHLGQRRRCPVRDRLAPGAHASRCRPDEARGVSLIHAPRLAGYSASTRWTSCTQTEPSPTAAATRFTLFARTSPTAKIPG